MAKEDVPKAERKVQRQDLNISEEGAHLKVRKNISFRKFDSGDVDGIVQLLNDVYGGGFTREWWRWKYELNPNGFRGQDGDVWVAESEGKIVGHYAILPMKMKYNTKLLNVVQSVDTSTHPNYRGVGIFSTLVKQVYSQARGRYSFLFGFPSEMAYGGFLKIGCKKVSTIPIRVKILNYDSYVQKRYGHSAIASYAKRFFKTRSKLSSYSKTVSSGTYKGVNVDIEKVEAFPEETDTFWGKASANYPIAIERDSMFLNWRFSQHFGSYHILLARSRKDKSIVGFVAFRRMDNAIAIFDLITLPRQENAASQLIDASITTEEMQGTDNVRCWMPQWHETAVTLAKKEFIPSEILQAFQKKYYPIMISYKFDENARIPRTSEWYYSLGDSDHL